MSPVVRLNRNQLIEWIEETEVGGFRRDIKEIAPAFLQPRQPDLTPKQKAAFDQGMGEAIERQKKSHEMEDRLFFSKEAEPAVLTAEKPPSCFVLAYDASQKKCCGATSCQDPGCSWR